jgi:hypothetical protein
MQEINKDDVEDVSGGVRFPGPAPVPGMDDIPGLPNPFPGPGWPNPCPMPETF